MSGGHDRIIEVAMTTSVMADNKNDSAYERVQENKQYNLKNNKTGIRSEWSWAQHNGGDVNL